MLLNLTAYVGSLKKNNPISDQEIFTTNSGFIVKINIQPASPELTAISEGEVFKTYKAFVTNSGVIEGMLLTVSGTNEIYRVRGREGFAYGAGQHFELTLARSNVNGT